MESIRTRVANRFHEDYDVCDRYFEYIYEMYLDTQAENPNINFIDFFNSTLHRILSNHTAIDNYLIDIEAAQIRQEIKHVHPTRYFNDM
jgi:hypothetical protein